jgi:hypothetical protein
MPLAPYKKLQQMGLRCFQYASFAEIGSGGVFIEISILMRLERIFPAGKT